MNYKKAMSDPSYDVRETEAKWRAALARDPDSPVALYELGIIAARAGRRDEAYRLFRHAERGAPPSGALLCALGRVAAQLDKDDEAQACFRRALDLGDDRVAALAGLGALALKRSRLDEAFRHLTEAIALAPARGDLRSNLAGVHARRGEFPQAETQLRAALATDPGNPELHNRLGVVLLAQGRRAEAVTTLRAALALAPDHNGNAETHHALGVALGALGRRDEAEVSLRAALALAPNHAEANCNLGILLTQEKRYTDALRYFETTLALQPENQTALARMGFALRSLSRIDEARAAFKRVSDRNPRHWRARWGLLTALPILYGNEREVADARRSFAEDLEALERDLPRHVATDHQAMVTAIASRTNFYLHYQGENDRDLQARYGALITQVAAAAFPQFTKPRMPARTDKIRVGFASTFLHNHSIAKTHGAWMTGLPRARFEVSLFHLGTVSDATTEQLKQHSRYYDCGRMNQATLVETLAGAGLDVLIWPDLGMESKAQIPAALRLAPVQANGGGHPITSGLAAMDYFLSSEMMEPAGAEAHYTEQLVRLPNLASCYPRPAGHGGTVPAIVATLRDTGQLLYLCNQSLYKLLPQDDRVFADIAHAVPGADFLFIAHPEPAITDLFRRRLGAAFADKGAGEDRIHIVPRLSMPDFYALNRAVDVVLDSFTWSGNNSTLEALAFDRPVVTLPGTMMRARHAAAILTRLDLPELIARDRADYVAIAAELGRDPALRASLGAKIAARSHRLYDDPAPISALAAWLEQVAGRAF